MSKSDRLGNLTLALVAAATLIFMAGVIGALLLDKYVERHQTYAEYQRNAESDRRTASQEIAESCGDRTGDAFRSCIAKHIESYYRDQATNQDLKAQQDMAYWAGALFISSTLLTGIGIYLLYGTLSATRETLREAETTNRIASQHFYEENRPWISIRDPRPLVYTEQGSDPIISVSVETKNLGKSPALSIRVYASFDIPVSTLGLINNLKDVEDYAAKVRNEKWIWGNTVLFPGIKTRLDGESDAIDFIVPDDHIARLIVCATYRGLGSSVVHHSARAFEISCRPIAATARDRDSREIRAEYIEGTDSVS